jgi:hypothetical protein
MTPDFAYQPVTAIAEAKAGGETDVVFVEIRQTVRIPLVTSIWRGLAGIDDSLRLVWATIQPDSVLDDIGRAAKALIRVGRGAVAWQAAMERTDPPT